LGAWRTGPGARGVGSHGLETLNPEPWVGSRGAGGRGAGGRGAGAGGAGGNGAGGVLRGMFGEYARPPQTFGSAWGAPDPAELGLVATANRAAPANRR